MRFEEFEKIKQPTWIRVSPPDSQYKSRSFRLVSSVKKVDRVIDPPSHYDAYIHAELDYAPETWADAGWDFYRPNKVRKVSDWDIEHASFVKRWPGANKRGILEDIFSGRAKKYGF